MFNRCVPFSGTVTPFPSVKIFCIYTAVCVLFTYVYQVTFFGACMAIAGYAERRNLHGLFCFPTLPRSLAKDKTWLFKLLCTGGINPNDPKNPEDNEEHCLMVFFRDWWGGILSKGWVKLVVIICFLVYLTVGIAGCTQIKEGLERCVFASLSRLCMHLLYVFCAPSETPLPRSPTPAWRLPCGAPPGRLRQQNFGGRARFARDRFDVAMALSARFSHSLRGDGGSD